MSSPAFVSRRSAHLLFSLYYLSCSVVAAKANEDDDGYEEGAHYSVPPTNRKYQTLLQETAGERRALSWADLDVWEFGVEMAIVLCLVLYLTLFFVGKGWNNDIARTYFKITSHIWEANYSQIGDGTGAKLLKDGPRDYVLFASGRAHVKSVYGKLHLAARHDMLQRLLDIMQPQNAYDKLTFTVILNENESDPMIFAIILKTLFSTVVADRWDLTEFPKKRDISARTAPFPNDAYSVLADAPEFLSTFWDDLEIRRKFWISMGLDEHGNGTPFEHPVVEQIVLSDLPKNKPTKLEDLREAPKVLTVALRLPKLSNPDSKARGAITAATELLMDLIDYIGQCGTVGPESRAKLVKLRQAAEQVITRVKEDERKEALAQRKLEEKKARAEQASKLSPEEQRKFEERERKKEAKKAQSKRMKKGRIMMG